MKSTTAILTVKLLGDNQTGKAFKEAQTQAQAFEQGVGKAAGVASAGLAGMAAAGVGAALAAEAVASANAVVGNVLGNMGMDKATGRVLDYADALEKSLGVDEKVIKGTQGKLATFSELAATADEAGGAFDRATMAALDMAAAGFGDAESNAVQLGKALQDPIKGVTALQRSGVTFTESQRDMIEAMVDAGDMAGAQNLILEELEKQVGGTAEANADASAKMKLSFGEIAEQVGTALLPVMDALLPKVEAFAKWAADNSGVILAIGGVVAAVAVAVVTLNAAMAIYNGVAKAAGVAADLWAKKSMIASGVTRIWGVVQAAFNLIMALNPIMLVVLAIVALIAIVVVAYQKSDAFRAAVDKLWQVLKGAFVAAIEAVKGALSSAWEWIKKVGDFLAGGFKAAVDAVKGAWDHVSGAISTVIGWFRSVWDWIKKVGDALSGFMSSLNPFKGGGARMSARITYAGTPAAARSGTVINVRPAGWNPQREAVEIARLLEGARVRTGFRGVRAA